MNLNSDTIGTPGTLHFPEEVGQRRQNDDARPWPDALLDQLNSMSRRIDDLAREFGCLDNGDDNDPPRAA